MSEETTIHSYSRAQAIADGMLVDIGDTAQHAGFKYPVALTHSVWSAYVKLPFAVGGEDEIGRLWDILNRLRYAINHQRTGTVTPFRLHVRIDSSDEDPPLIELRAVCGPDDDGGQCITVMLPQELAP